MKTVTLISAFALAGSLTAGAQGVHLNAGESISFGFNSVDGPHSTELAPGSAVNVMFGTDLLGPGESLRLEMFENSLEDPPFATRTYSPTTLVPSVLLGGPFSYWLDYQGLVRVSMVSGSVDVLGGHFAVSPDVNNYFDTAVAVPEPSAMLLIALGTLTGAAVWVCRRSRSEFATGRLVKRQ